MNGILAIELIRAPAREPIDTIDLWEAVNGNFVIEVWASLEAASGGPI